VIRDVPPDSVETGRALMVAAISTDVSGEISSAYNTIWLVAGVFTIGSFLILTAVHWAYVRSRRRLQAANDALAAQNEAVRESRERMIAASDMTKRAIAEELHGTVQTKLFSLWLRLSQVKTKLDRGDGADMLELGAVIAELDSVRENDIRGLSHRLHPSIVRVGAAPALKSLCGGLSGAVKIELKIDPAAARLEPLGASQIPEDIRLAAYRIAEMAIGNTIKHASASKCTVTWSYSRSKSRLELTVEDDGAGFDPASRAPSGLGIVNIQDYTDALGGEVSLESRPGHGTTLRAHIPFIAPPTPLQTPAQTFGKRSQSGPDEMARAA
jgi:signal transduction histidine kinase